MVAEKNAAVDAFQGRMMIFLINHRRHSAAVAQFCNPGSIMTSLLSLLEMAMAIPRVSVFLPRPKDMLVAGQLDADGGRIGGGEAP